MSKPIIAVDVDEVLASSAQDFVDFSNKRWGTHLTIDDYQEHWGEMWGVDHETVMQRSDEWHAAKATIDHGVKDDALAVLQHLSKKYDLVITTSRRKEIEQETYVWIEKHFKGIFSAVYFSGIWDAAHEGSHAVTKTDLCKKVGAQYLIDDQPKHVISAAENGITGLLFGTYSWNTQDDLPKGVYRLENWQKVREYFDAEQ